MMWKSHQHLSFNHFPIEKVLSELETKARAHCAKNPPIPYIWRLSDHDYIEGVQEATLPIMQRKLHGTARLYYPGGAIMAVIHYRDDKRHGPLQYLDAYGNIQFKTNFCNDKPQKTVLKASDGRVLSFFQNELPWFPTRLS